MAVGAVGNRGVCGFPSSGGRTLRPWERRRPRSVVLRKVGIVWSAPICPRLEAPRSPSAAMGEGFRPDPRRRAAQHVGRPAPCVEPVGRKQCARSRTTMHGAGAGAVPSTEPAGASRYVNVKPRHPDSHGHGTGMEGSGLDHGPRTRAKYCQPYCQPFLSPRVLFSPRESSVGPRFTQQNRGLLRFLDCRERVRSQTLYPAELRARSCGDRNRNYTGQTRPATASAPTDGTGRGRPCPADRISGGKYRAESTRARPGGPRRG